MYSYRLVGEINDNTLIDFSNFVDSLEQGANVTLYISSYGGDCFMTMGIIDLMHRKQLNTTAIILGLAASAAAIIAISCNKVIMSPLGHIMLHSAWSENPNDKEGVNAANDAQFRVIHNRCPTLSEEDIFNKSDKWIDADTALNLGLVDSIDSSYAISALTNRINTQYKGVVEMDKTKVEEQVIQVDEQVEQVEEQIAQGENADVSLLSLIEKLAERVAALEEILNNSSSAEANAEGESVDDDEEQKRMEALYAKITSPLTVSAKADTTTCKRNKYKVSAKYKDYING